MNVVRISKSNRKNKKMVAEFPNGERLHFGDDRYQDFTIHQDPERKKRYLARHKGDPKSLHTPGGLSRDILWSKPNIASAAKYAGQKHGVRVLLDGNLLRK
jgi:hypothetical protein